MKLDDLLQLLNSSVDFLCSGNVAASETEIEIINPITNETFVIANLSSKWSDKTIKIFISPKEK